MENAPGPSTPSEPAANVHKPLNNSSVSQGFIAVVSLFPCIISGLILGYTGISMWNLPMTYRNSTWFASLAALGAAAGCLIARTMINAFGPRGTVLLSHVLCAIGWMLTVSSLTTVNFLMGRLLTGMFVGLVSVSAGAYSVECFPTRPSARPVIYVATGVLFVYLAGSLLSYVQTAFIALAATVVSFVLIRVFVPESPAWLESRGRAGDAEYSRLKLRLVTVQKTDTDGGDHSAETPPVADGLWFVRNGVYRPFLALCLHFALQQFSGPLVLVTYATQLVDDASVQVLNSYFVAVVLAIFLVVGSIVSTAMRHTESVATLSSVGTLAASLLIVMYNLCRSMLLNRFASRLLSFVPLFGLLAFMTFSCTVLMPNVPIKNAPGEHVAMAFSYAVGFFVIKAYPYVHNLMGWWVFVFFSAASALNIVIGVLMFYEPKSKHATNKSSAEPTV